MLLVACFLIGISASALAWQILCSYEQCFESTMFTIPSFLFQLIIKDFMRRVAPLSVHAVTGAVKSFCLP